MRAAGSGHGFRTRGRPCGGAGRCSPRTACGAAPGFRCSRVGTSACAAWYTRCTVAGQAPDGLPCSLKARFHIAPHGWPATTLRRTVGTLQHWCRRHAPDVVLCSWMELAEDWTGPFRRHAAVREYCRTLCRRFRTLSFPSAPPTRCPYSFTATPDFRACLALIRKLPALHPEMRTSRPCEGTSVLAPGTS